MAKQTIHVDDYDKDSQKGRFRLIFLLMAVTFALLTMRLVNLQLMRGRHFEKISRAQKLRKISLRPIRGDILDRRGESMAATRQGFELLLYADPSLRKVTDLAGSISELIDIPREEIEKKFEERHRIAKFQPTIIVDDLSRSQVAALEENLTDLDCLEVASIPRRVYPQGKSASQLVGHLGEVTGKELDNTKPKKYKPGDLVGRMGGEQAFENLLRGRRGSEQVVVDSTGRRNVLFEKELRLEQIKIPETGNTIELTIDMTMQRACEKALGEVAGAAVVMDVHTGEILAMASTPSFDPNLMMGELDPRQWKKLADDERRPFFYRPLQGEYPPGSVFKIVVAAAALQEKVIGYEEPIRCRGVVELGANLDEYHCWNPTGHGMVNFQRGLVESCDIYYYRLGERLGIDVIRKYARNFGLGYAPGTDLPGEKAGLVPGPLWKRRFIGKSWYLGDTVITAIGQGYTLLSPLQVTRMMSVIANGGKLLRPRLLRRILDQDGNVLEDFVPEVEIPRVISPEVCGRITHALVGVVHDPRGTGYNCLGPLPVRVAGKTGTAQVISRSRKKIFIGNQGEIPWKYRDHAWFTAFVPAVNPRVAITVLVEHGGAGSVAAGPICGEIIRYYIRYLYSQARRENGGA